MFINIYSQFLCFLQICNKQSMGQGWSADHVLYSIDLDHIKLEGFQG